VVDTSSPRQWLGLAAIGIGVVLLGTCIWEFARRGVPTCHLRALAERLDQGIPELPRKQVF